VTEVRDVLATELSPLILGMLRWRERTIGMKQLLNGVAFAAALVIAAPVWAQNPSGGNGMGMPGPNSGGGGGLTPYSTGTAPATSATPPAHHAVRHARAMHAFHRHMAAKAALTGDTTAQLNREELARIQSGGPPSPPPPPAAPMPTPENPSGGNAMGMPGPNTGGPGLTPYGGGAPPQH
jgi:hypothetical protein